MRHQKRIKKLGKPSKHRRAVHRSMLTSLFKYERITTTITKAKVARSLADRLITTALKGSLASKRKIIAYLTERDVAHKLIGEIAPRYADNPTGGYTRVLRLGPRKGDAAEMAILELVNPAEKGAKEKPQVKRKAKAKPTSSEAAKDKKKKEPAAEIEIEAKDETITETPQDEETVTIAAEETQVIEPTPETTEEQTQPDAETEETPDVTEPITEEATSIEEVASEKEPELESSGTESEEPKSEKP